MSQNPFGDEMFGAISTRYIADLALCAYFNGDAPLDRKQVASLLSDSKRHLDAAEKLCGTGHSNRASLRQVQWMLDGTLSAAAEAGVVLTESPSL